MRIEVDGKEYSNFVGASAVLRLDALSNTFSFETTAADAVSLPFRIVASAIDPAETISVPGMPGRPTREMSRSVLASIIEPRMEEIFSLVAREMKHVLHDDVLACGMVLTGGGALLPGTLELAEQMFDMPAREGTILGFEHVPDDINNSRYATAHGLLHYGFTHDPNDHTRAGATRALLRRIEHWIANKF